MPPDEEKETQRATPVDPLSELTQQSVSLHELYLTFTAVGFTEDQALTLIAKTISENGRRDSNG